MLVLTANRANMLANILTNNVGSNVRQHVATVCESLKTLRRSSERLLNVSCTLILRDVSREKLPSQHCLKKFLLENWGKSGHIDLHCIQKIGFNYLVPLYTWNKPKWESQIFIPWKFMEARLELMKHFQKHINYRFLKLTWVVWEI